MDSGQPIDDKELYRQLRKLPCERLWSVEVNRFDRASPAVRLARVAVVRAVGVVYSESGTPREQEIAREWLRKLLRDPQEKIRRYAMAALPKLGAGPGEEAQLIAMLRAPIAEREKKHLVRSLERIGGHATLAQAETGAIQLTPEAEQKIKASVVRAETPGTIDLDAQLTELQGLRVHLRGRAGLEHILRAEVDELIAKRGLFQVAAVTPGLVALVPIAPFSLDDLYSLRCFSTVSFVPEVATSPKEAGFVGALADIITSPAARLVFRTLTQGPIRYRLEFVGKGHQRSLVREVAGRAYELCPQILNSPSEALWEVAVIQGKGAPLVELRPRLGEDPRFAYRLEDVPAASHPPLAASMVRLAGPMQDEVVWDPFCGSGVELIERTIAGGVRKVFGTDCSAEAVAISERNFVGANFGPIEASFVCSDFRDFRKVPGLSRGAVSLVISNPPLGRRVPIPQLDRLILDLFSAAETVLRPGGRLVFVNPLPLNCPSRTLRLQSRQVVDLGGFDARLELYHKIG